MTVAAISASVLPMAKALVPLTRIQIHPKHFIGRRFDYFAVRDVDGSKRVYGIRPNREKELIPADDWNEIKQK